jgi:Flp pilus assembly protein TadG
MSGNELHTHEETREPTGDRRGVTMVTVVVGLVALIGATALAIDVGAMWVAKTQLQNAADAAALAAASNMIDKSVPATTLGTATTVAQQVGNANQAISAANVDILSTDVTYGDWDLDTRTFDTSVDLTDPSQVTAADVVTRMSSAANGPLPAFMSRILGRQSYDVRADATAYLGFAGRVGPDVVPLPVVLDCCELTGDACNGQFCPDIQTNKPNPCDLDDAPQDVDFDAGGNPIPVTCLEFASTGEQNACWTSFEHTSSVNSSDMTDIIENAVPFHVNAGDEYYVDNGTKTTVVEAIHDRMSGEDGFGDAAGQDYYEPKDGVKDSWVTLLPVVECQDGVNCATGTEAEIKGFVCFEVREVLVTPEKIIKGTFMCPNHPRWDECMGKGPFGSGGDDFSIRADIPVLVR